MSNNLPKPPSYLGPCGAAYWTQVVSDFEVEPSDLTLLAACCAFLDRAAEAREIIQDEGVTVVDSKGGRKEHPAVATERNSLLGFVRARRELGIDTPAPDSRPATRLARYR